MSQNYKLDNILIYLFNLYSKYLQDKCIVIFPSWQTHNYKITTTPLLDYLSLILNNFRIYARRKCLKEILQNLLYFCICYSRFLVYMSTDTNSKYSSKWEMNTIIWTFVFQKYDTFWSCSSSWRAQILKLLGCAISRVALVSNVNICCIQSHRLCYKNNINWP